MEFLNYNQHQLLKISLIFWGMLLENNFCHLCLANDLSFAFNGANAVWREAQNITIKESNHLQTRPLNQTENLEHFPRIISKNFLESENTPKKRRSVWSRICSCMSLSRPHHTKDKISPYLSFLSHSGFPHSKTHIYPLPGVYEFEREEYLPSSMLQLMCIENQSINEICYQIIMLSGQICSKKSLEELKVKLQGETTLSIVCDSFTMIDVLDHFLYNFSLSLDRLINILKEYQRNNSHIVVLSILRDKIKQEQSLAECMTLKKYQQFFIEFFRCLEGNSYSMLQVFKNELKLIEERIDNK